MAEVATSVKLQFLPIGPAPPERAKPHKAYRDRYDDPKVQLAGRLGQYGFDKLAIIISKYPTYTDAWESAFGKILNAYALALSGRDTTFDKAKLEREADAARDAFILSLVTVGAMVFLGAWVQYSLVPRAKIRRSETLTNPSAADYMKGAYSGNKAKFSHLQAKMFGGLTEEVGGRVIEHEFPKPTAILNPQTSLSLLESLRNGITRQFKEANKVVVKSLTDAHKWMIVDTDFGEAWAAYTGGNEAKATAEIRLRINTLRDKWAKEWQFFGQIPREIAVPLLANQYERSLWAGYIVNLFDQAVEAMQLEPGRKDQDKRKKEGSPGPEVTIKGAVNRGHDIKEIYRWADGFLRHAAVDNAYKFFPPAQPRTLEPL